MKKLGNFRRRNTDGYSARAVTAALRTIRAMGYSWCGGAQWKPPLGKPPAFVLSQPQEGRALSDERELWDLLDAVDEALDRKAAPHAWVSIARMAGNDFIMKRRAANAAEKGELK